MDTLQMVMEALDGVNAAIGARTGIGAMFGIPWCVLMAIGASTLFQTFFSRH